MQCSINCNDEGTCDEGAKHRTAERPSSAWRFSRGRVLCQGAQNRPIKGREFIFQPTAERLDLRAIAAACGNHWAGTSPVGSFKPNVFGLYDMAGNVWQWVQDCYHDNYNGAPTDGSEWTVDDCKLRVIRGGSWGPSSVPGALRPAYRFRLDSDFRNTNLGFRLGRTLSVSDGL